MSYTALYRKFRPITFNEIVGQEHITKTLKNQLIAGRVGHAYLFNGSRGTGKTSAAKILARAVNCLNPKDGEPCNECEICKAALAGSLTDIVEMDAASNNSVEDIRSIREEVNFLPTTAKYRIYIIDEVHMLSIGAFNALLKTLEEPPEHVKFILATTEPQKLPSTILSRCQRFDFKRISNENIIKRLKIICEKSQIEITQEALNTIAILAEGAMRDALSILERCLQEGEGKIDENKVKDLVGIPKTTFIHQIIQNIIEYNIEEALKSLNQVLNEGKDINNLLWEIIKYIKDILILKTTGEIELYNKEEIDKMNLIAKDISKERLLNMIYQLSELENDIKWSSQKTIMLQVGIMKLCNPQQDKTIEGLEKRVEALENTIKKGTIRLEENKITEAINPRVTTNVIEIKKEPEKAKISKPIVSKTNAKAAEYWPKVINELKQNGKIMLYTNLINTTAKEVNDLILGIEFPNGLTPFGKTILEKTENISELNRLVSIEAGKEMKVKYIDARQIEKVETEDVGLEGLVKGLDIPIDIVDE